MNINLTEKEYRMLLDLVFLADLIQTARHGDRDSENDPYQMLFQKIYSYAAESGSAELVEAVKESNRYAPTRKYEEQSEVFDWIEDYDDLVFWEELITRFAERDLLAELSEDERNRLAPEQFWQRVGPYEQQYAEEFESRGIDRLVVDRNRRG